MEFITLYESATTDGYTTTGHGRYFLSNVDAIADVANQGGHGRVIEHKNFVHVDGEYFELKQRKGITISKSKKEEETIRKNALAKLTKEEQHLLGLK